MTDPTTDYEIHMQALIDAAAQAIYEYRRYGDFRDQPNADFYRHQARPVVEAILAEQERARQ